MSSCRRTSRSALEERASPIADAADAARAFSPSYRSSTGQPPFGAPFTINVGAVGSATQPAATADRQSTLHINVGCTTQPSTLSVPTSYTPSQGAMVDISSGFLPRATIDQSHLAARSTLSSPGSECGSLSSGYSATSFANENDPPYNPECPSYSATPSLASTISSASSPIDTAAVDLRRLVKVQYITPLPAPSTTGRRVVAHLKAVMGIESDFLNRLLYEYTGHRVVFYMEATTGQVMGGCFWRHTGRAAPRTPAEDDILFTLVATSAQLLAEQRLELMEMLLEEPLRYAAAQMRQPRFVVPIGKHWGEALIRHIHSSRAQPRLAASWYGPLPDPTAAAVAPYYPPGWHTRVLLPAGRHCAIFDYVSKGLTLPAELQPFYTTNDLRRYVFCGYGHDVHSPRKGVVVVYRHKLTNLLVNVPVDSRYITNPKELSKALAQRHCRMRWKASALTVVTAPVYTPEQPFGAARPAQSPVQPPEPHQPVPKPPQRQPALHKPVPRKPTQQPKPVHERPPPASEPFCKRVNLAGSSYYVVGPGVTPSVSAVLHTPTGKPSPTTGKPSPTTGTPSPSPKQ